MPADGQRVEEAAVVGVHRAGDAHAVFAAVAVAEAHTFFCGAYS